LINSAACAKTIRISNGADPPVPVENYSQIKLPA
jgi:hypothetical protein